MADIVLLSDARVIKERKQEELRYYHERLTSLLGRRMYIDQELALTTRIIEMIDKELL